MISRKRALLAGAALLGVVPLGVLVLAGTPRSSAVRAGLWATLTVAGLAAAAALRRSAPADAPLARPTLEPDAGAPDPGAPAGETIPLGPETTILRSARSVLAPEPPPAAETLSTPEEVLAARARTARLIAAGKYEDAEALMDSILATGGDEQRPWADTQRRLIELKRARR